MQPWRLVSQQHVVLVLTFSTSFLGEVNISNELLWWCDGCVLYPDHRMHTLARSHLFTIPTLPQWTWKDLNLQYVCNYNFTCNGTWRRGPCPLATIVCWGSLYVISCHDNVSFQTVWGWIVRPWIYDSNPNWLEMSQLVVTMKQLKMGLDLLVHRENMVCTFILVFVPTSFLSVSLASAQFSSRI